MHLVSLIVLGSQSNHVLVAIAVDTTIIANYSSNRQRWCNQCSANSFLLLIVLYSVTAFHKLNGDFFDAEVSCASLFVSGLFSMFFPIPTNQPTDIIANIIQSAPYHGASLEILLPLMLVLSQITSKTLSSILMKVVFIFGTIFHLSVCLPLPPMSVYPFSMVMVPMYLLLLPVESEVLFNKMLKNWQLLLAITAATALFLSISVNFVLDGHPLPLEYPNYGLWPAAILWNVLIWGALLSVSVLSPRLPPPNLKGNITVPSVVLLVLFTVLGLSPYLGIRNYPALAMFSNLRTSSEGFKSNHFFVPEDSSVGRIGNNNKLFITIHRTDLPSFKYGQINLANYFLPHTVKFNEAYGVKNEFWINPPEWTAMDGDVGRPFVEYSIPFIEFKRRIAKALLRDEPFELEISWNNDPTSRHFFNGTDRSLARESPLTQLEAFLFRFRSFDASYSPCRH